MNILKHMEAVFVATVALAVSGSYLVDTLPQAHAQPVASSAGAAVPVVVVKAKRMSDEEKQRSIQAERASQSSRI